MGGIDMVSHLQYGDWDLVGDPNEHEKIRNLGFGSGKN